MRVAILPQGHLAALRKLESCPGCVTYNLGTGTGYSVLDMVKAYSAACGRDLPYEMTPRRPGDVGVVYADPTYAKQVTPMQRPASSVCNVLRHKQTPPAATRRPHACSVPSLTPNTVPHSEVSLYPKFTPRR